jgi:very-short-patch-repair endonuclease
VTVPYGRGSRREGVRIHRSRAIDPRDVTVLKGVPIATPALALLEIAKDLSFDVFERAFDDALTGKVMSLTGAQQTLARHQGSRGAGRFALLAHPDHELEITRSRAEQLMKRLARRGGLAGWRLNWRRGRIFPDMMFDGEKVIVEVDGFRTHGTRTAFESDRARDAKLAAEGWIVLRFTWRQLTEQPELVLVRLAQTLALRRAA